MKLVLKVLLSFSILAAGWNAQAAKFKGYRKPLDSKTIILDEPLDRFEEEDGKFLILVARHAAFYKFPKDKENGENIREFLNSRLKNKKNIILEIDPMTTEIHQLSGQ